MQFRDHRLFINCSFAGTAGTAGTAAAAAAAAALPRIASFSESYKIVSYAHNTQILSLVIDNDDLLVHKVISLLL
ncbi:hypothetical protein PS6_003377 [Mucor atramentarius]